MNPTTNMAMAAQAEKAPSGLQVVETKWEEPYSPVIADNLDLLADEIPTSLLCMRSVHLHILHHDTRPRPHPALHFSLDTASNGKIQTIEQADPEEEVREGFRITVARVEPLGCTEELPATMNADHTIADIAYPNRFSDTALETLLSTIVRYNGPRQDRHPSYIE